MDTIKVNDIIWNLVREHKTCRQWSSIWYCLDGDTAELYVEKDGSGFEIHCFSGITGESVIKIGRLDFGTLWRKANYTEPIQNYSHEEQCVIIANFLCSLFCEK